MCVGQRVGTTFRFGSVRWGGDYRKQASKHASTHGRTHARTWQARTIRRRRRRRRRSRDQQQHRLCARMSDARMHRYVCVVCSRVPTGASSNIKSSAAMPCRVYVAGRGCRAHAMINKKCWSVANIASHMHTYMRRHARIQTTLQHIHDIHTAYASASAWLAKLTTMACVY